MPIPVLDPTLTPFFAAFLFVFAVVYGALFTAKVFEKPKSVNIIIALAFAIFAATYKPLVDTLYNFLPIAAIFLIIIFFIQFLRKSLGGKNKKIDALPPTIALGIALLLLGLLWNNVFYYLQPFGISSYNLLYIIGIVVVVAIFWLIYNHSSGSQGAPTP